VTLLIPAAPGERSTLSIPGLTRTQMASSTLSAWSCGWRNARSPLARPDGLRLHAIFMPQISQYFMARRWYFVLLAPLRPSTDHSSTARQRTRRPDPEAAAPLRQVLIVETSREHRTLPKG